MIAVPLPRRRPRGRPHPCYEHHRPDPTPPPGFLSKNFSGTPGVSDPTARQCRRDHAPLPQARPVRTGSWTRSIAKILTSRPHNAAVRALPTPLRRRDVPYRDRGPAAVAVRESSEAVEDERSLDRGVQAGAGAYRGNPYPHTEQVASRRSSWLGVCARWLPPVRRVSVFLLYRTCVRQKGMAF